MKQHFACKAHSDIAAWNYAKAGLNVKHYRINGLWTVEIVK